MAPNMIKVNMKSIDLEHIHNDLQHLINAIAEIKAKIFDVDIVLDNTDIEAIAEYEKEKKEGKLISQTEVKKILQL